MNVLKLYVSAALNLDYVPQVACCDRRVLIEVGAVLSAEASAVCVLETRDGVNVLVTRIIPHHFGGTQRKTRRIKAVISSWSEHASIHVYM